MFISTYTYIEKVNPIWFTRCMCFYAGYNIPHFPLFVMKKKRNTNERTNHIFVKISKSSNDEKFFFFHIFLFPIFLYIYIFFFAAVVVCVDATFAASHPIDNTTKHLNNQPTKQLAAATIATTPKHYCRNRKQNNN